MGVFEMQSQNSIRNNAAIREYNLNQAELARGTTDYQLGLLGIKEAEKNRAFSAEQNQARWDNIVSILFGGNAGESMGQYGAGISGEGGLMGEWGKGFKMSDSPALKALEDALAYRGGEANREISSEFARKGAFRSGQLDTAIAKNTAETSANVAGARADYTQSAYDTYQRQQEALVNMIGQILGGYAN